MTRFMKDMYFCLAFQKAEVEDLYMYCGRIFSKEDLFVELRYGKFTDFLAYRKLINVKK